jgi:hypothetical protein
MVERCYRAVPLPAVQRTIETAKSVRDLRLRPFLARYDQRLPVLSMQTA